MRFERLAKELHPEHDLTKQPLVQVLFSFHQRTSSQRVERRRDLAVGFDDVNLSLEGAEVFDLALAISDAEQGFQAQFEYDDEPVRPADDRQHDGALPDAAGGRGRRSRPAAVATAAVEPRDREQVLVEWNQTPSELPPPRSASTSCSRPRPSAPPRPWPCGATVKR